MFDLGTLLAALYLLGALGATALALRQPALLVMADTAAARRRWPAALRLARLAGGAADVEARALNHVAVAALRRGGPGAAGPMLQRALALAAGMERGPSAGAAGRPYAVQLQVLTLTNLGSCLMAERRHAAARDALAHAAAAIEAAGRPGPGDEQAAGVYYCLARLALREGDPAAAGAWNRRALETLAPSARSDLARRVLAQRDRLAGGCPAAPLFDATPAGG